MILAVAVVIFRLARPACLRFMEEEDFRTRRTAWFILTIAAFLSPIFWMYALIAVPVSFWAGRRDSNPVALYLVLMYAAPAFSAHIPKIIDVDQQRLLAMTVLIPALLRSAPDSPSARVSGHGAGFAGFLLFAYCTLQAALFLPYESWTSVLRREITLLLSTLLPYLAYSRATRTYRSIPDVLAAFVLSCVIMAPLAVFESLRGWQLYAEVADSWGMGVNRERYLMRGAQLRALVATHHSLALGLVFAIGFGFSLYLMRTWKSGKTAVWTYALIWAGLFAAYARSGWISAMLLMFAYFFLLPGGAGRVTKTAILVLLGGIVASFTPFGQRILDSLPFVGSMDAGSVDYRQLLLEESLRLIPEHPWFGDLLVKQKMSALIQGQGIVDLVNGYLQIALLFGLVTLATVVLFMLIALGRTWRASRRVRSQDEPAARLGSVLVAGMLAIFFFIWTAGFAEQLWMLAGLGAAYARLVANGAHLRDRI